MYNCALDCHHSDWCEMVPHSGFDLHLSDNEFRGNFIFLIEVLVDLQCKSMCSFRYIAK